MKIDSIEIHNIGLHADTAVKIDRPVMAFYGEPMSGKTTILRCVGWAIGGEFPDDIIRHGAAEASIKIKTLEPTGSIERTFYRGKNGVTARPIQCVQNGQVVKRPADELRKFVNPFLSNQDYLRYMTPTKRKEFFRELFPLDTAALDKEAAQVEAEASGLRSKLKGYGDIDLTEVEPVDVSALKAELAAKRQEARAKAQAWTAECDGIRRLHNEACEARRQTHSAAVSSVEAANREALELDSLRQRSAEKVSEIAEQIKALQKQISDLVEKQDATQKWLAAHPAKPQTPQPPAPALPAMPALPPPPAAEDTSDLEAKIQNGAAQNVRAEQFKANQKRAQDREADRKALAAMEDRRDAIKAEKTALLEGASAKCGIKDFQIGPTGDFTFEGTASDMLSESQMMRLSQAISGLYPEGFDISLVDRGESLGRKGIESLVERALSDERNVLVTVVGDAPAQSPPEIGVFVVESGSVKPAGKGAK